MRHFALSAGVLAASSVCVAQWAPQMGHSVRAVTDERGMHLIESAGMARPAKPGTGTGGADNILWVFFDQVSIPENVTIGPSNVWVGQHLNNRRFQRFETTGSGVPAVEYPGSAFAIGGVAAAKDADLAVYIDRLGQNDSFVLRAYRAANAASIWSYTFPVEFNSMTVRNVKVSRDGSIVCALVSDTVANMAVLHIIDGPTGDPIRQWTFVGGTAAAIDINDDASLCLVTQGTTARLIDTTTATEIHTVTGSGVGGYYRISGNGDVLMVGGFSLNVQKRTGGVYSQVLTFTAPSNWFGAGMAVSRDGNTIGVMSHNYATGYVERTVRMWDVPTLSLIGQFAVGGSGTQQGSVSGAEMSDDGEVFAVSSWGTADNAFPEVLIFDRTMQMIGAIDTVGSVFGLAMHPTGAYVVAGNKNAHANTFGNGGHVTTFEVFPPGAGCYANCDASTVQPILNIDDFTCFINEFAVGQSLPHGQQLTHYANCDQSTTAPVLNIDDFTCFINAFAIGCE